MASLSNITGTCVSPGEIIGTICFYKKNIKYSKKDIVYLNEWLTSGVALLKNAGGLLSNHGGLTCHASIIAREYKIPCLVALKNYKILKEGQLIKLNATAETITIL